MSSKGKGKATPPAPPPSPSDKSKDKKKVKKSSRCRGVWKIGKKLGAGGLGDVYKGENISTGATVVIKKAKLKAGKDPTRILRRSCFEAAVLAYLTAYGCGICVQSVDACFSTKEHLWVVMEYLGKEDGWMDLFDFQGLTKDLSGWTKTEKLKLGIEIGEAIQAIHNLGIIHRDLKPENMMINERTREVKLIDFGLACVIPGRRSTVKTFSPPGCPVDIGKMSCSGGAGTRRYIHPDVRGGKNVKDDFTLDSYSYIIILNEILRTRNMSERLAGLLDREGYKNTAGGRSSKQYVYKDRLDDVPTIPTILTVLQEELDMAERVTAPPGFEKGKRESTTSPLAEIPAWLKKSAFLTKDRVPSREVIEEIEAMIMEQDLPAKSMFKECEKRGIENECRTEEVWQLLVNRDFAEAKLGDSKSWHDRYISLYMNFPLNIERINTFILEDTYLEGFRQALQNYKKDIDPKEAIETIVWILTNDYGGLEGIDPYLDDFIYEAAYYNDRDVLDNDELSPFITQNIDPLIRGYITGGQIDAFKDEFFDDYIMEGRLAEKWLEYIYTNNITSEARDFVNVLNNIIYQAEAEDIEEDDY